jgi:hypothetical protein
MQSTAPRPSKIQHTSKIKLIVSRAPTVRSRSGAGPPTSHWSGIQAAHLRVRGVRRVTGVGAGWAAGGGVKGHIQVFQRGRALDGVIIGNFIVLT